MDARYQRIDLATADLTPLLEPLKAGIAWLQSPQDPNAVLHHLGLYLVAASAPLHLSITLTPYAWRGLPVLVFTKGWIESAESLTGRAPDVYQPDEVHALRRLIQQTGSDIHSQWNGAGCHSVSFALRKVAGSQLIAAVDNYAFLMKKYGFAWPPDESARYDLLQKPDGWR